MKLLLKFNLVFVLVFALALAATSYVSWTLLERNARDEIAQNARLLMDTALAARAYTSSQVNPLLETQMKYTFLPQSVPAYSATEVFNDLRKKHTEYGYKEAVLNPTNPRNRAVDWETDLITQFRGNKDTTELIGDRDTPTGRSFYVARPIRISNPACLRCHSTVDAAPKTMLERYGPANGFGWTLNDVVGAQIISVPTQVPLERAQKAFTVFMGSIAAVFVVIGIVLNTMLWALVIRPIGKLSQFADRVSLGELEIPEFKRSSGDEIGMLARSIARMRTSMVQAMKMLES
ncbi:Tll0287-like domain-containing protein [Piscinibacter sp.]|jgi:protein-histidine pros-kinase|uniref:Tll0287-like domain-containing protein n=1 Tax=Piscinibacter sp. TaxID=1903157 RepID=UPI002F42AFD3